MNSQFRRSLTCTITVLAMFLLPPSCSVKEDRRICPCILEVAFAGRERIEDPVTLVGWSDREVFDDRINTVDYPDVYTHNTPRSLIAFGAVQGLDKCVRKGHTVIIPTGIECDSLYAYSDAVDCSGETARTTVVFHKQFATVHMGIINTDFDADDFSLVLKSHSCGIDLLTCEATEGEFRCIPRFEDDNKYRCRICRQRDDSIALDVTHASGDNVTFPLGKVVSSIGYDWNAVDLQDIFITLDIAKGRIGVGVAGWESIEDLELSTVEL